MSINSDITAKMINLYNQIKKDGGLWINNRFYEVKNFIPNTTISKICMISIYNQFVKEEFLLPIEKLETDHKESLVAECRLTGQQFTNETLIATSKILHLIKTINENT